MSENVSEPSRAVALYHGPATDASPLARYGTSKAVRIVADRMMRVEKGAQGLTQDEALLVAQAALATGLSPFEPQPELWHWIAVKDGRRMLTIMRGRDGTIRLAEEAARRDGTYLLPARFTQIKDQAEKQSLGFEPTELVFRCDATDKRTSDEYYQRRKELSEEGLSSQQIDERLGTFPPGDTGYGSMSMSEMAALNKGQNKMPHVNRVRKRAYIESLKQKWAAHVNMEALTENAPTDPEAYLIEDEWLDAELDESGRVVVTGTTKGKRQTRRPRGKPGLRPYAPETVKKGVAQQAEKFKDTSEDAKIGKMLLWEFAVWQLNECWPGDDAQTDNRHALQKFLFDVDSAKELTPAQARAIIDWLKPKENQIGDLVPNALSVKEARAILESLKEGDDGETEEEDA